MNRPRLARRMQEIERTAERRQVMLSAERLAEIAGCTVGELERGAEELARRFERAGATTHAEKIAFLAKDNGLPEQDVIRAYDEVLELLSCPAH